MNQSEQPTTSYEKKPTPSGLDQLISSLMTAIEDNKTVDSDGNSTVDKEKAFDKINSEIDLFINNASEETLKQTRKDLEEKLNEVHKAVLMFKSIKLPENEELKIKTAILREIDRSVADALHPAPAKEQVRAETQEAIQSLKADLEKLAEGETNPQQAEILLRIGNTLTTTMSTVRNRLEEMQQKLDLMEGAGENQAAVQENEDSETTFKKTETAESQDGTESRSIFTVEESPSGEENLLPNGDVLKLTEDEAKNLRKGRKIERFLTRHSTTFFGNQERKREWQAMDILFDNAFDQITSEEKLRNLIDLVRVGEHKLDEMTEGEARELRVFANAVHEVFGSEKSVLREGLQFRPEDHNLEAIRQMKDNLRNTFDRTSDKQPFSDEITIIDRAYIQDYMKSQKDFYLAVFTKKKEETARTQDENSAAREASEDSKPSKPEDKKDDGDNKNVYAETDADKEPSFISNEASLPPEVEEDDRNVEAEADKKTSKDEFLSSLENVQASNSLFTKRIIVGMIMKKGLQKETKAQINGFLEKATDDEAKNLINQFLEALHKYEEKKRSTSKKRG